MKQQYYIVFLLHWRFIALFFNPKFISAVLNLTLEFLARNTYKQQLLMHCDDVYLNYSQEISIIKQLQYQITVPNRG